MHEIAGLLESLKDINSMLVEKRPRSKCCKAVTYTVGDKGVTKEICSDCGSAIHELTEC